MSILNIKNFPDDLHDKLRERAKRCLLYTSDAADECCGVGV